MSRLLVALLLCGCLAQGSDSGEWLVRLVSFIEWPGAVRQEPVVVGVVGDAAESLPRGLSLARGNSLAVKRVTTVGEMRRCQILLVGRSYAGQARQLLRSVEGAPTLTVSVIVGFSQMGGMVELREEQGDRFFRLNTEAARRSKLAFHPGLLSVAALARADSIRE